MSDKVSSSILIALEELLEERERIDAAIAQLQRFLEDSGGVPQRTEQPTYSDAPGNELLGLVTGAKPRSRKGWTPEARRAAAERMKQYWAQRRSRGELNFGSANTGPMPRRKPRSTQGWTPEARQAAADRMRRYWAQRKEKESDASQAG